MSLLQQPWDQEPPESQCGVEPGTHYKVARRTVQHLGHGAFACPACDLPILLGAAIAVSAEVECPFCRRVASARRFVRFDAIDTTYNEVYLRARLPA